MCPVQDVAKGRQVRMLRWFVYPPQLRRIHSIHWQVSLLRRRRWSWVVGQFLDDYIHLALTEIP